MSTVEVDLEREKSAKIAAVAERAGHIAAELGLGPDKVIEFLSHYFRHVDPDDVEERSISDLLGLVESHYRLAQQRPSARPIVHVWRPTEEDDGWTSGGATVVQVVTDDRPFLVDSVTMEVLRQGWSIREVFHPQFTVRRDVAGALQTVVHTKDAEGDPTILGESWMHLEIMPPGDQSRADSRDEELAAGLFSVLRDVEDAVQDWDKFQQKVQQAIDDLDDTPEIVHPGEVADARELLDWLKNHHFTFLGYREYTLVEDDAGRRYEPVPATGLGILRGDQDVEGAFHALPPKRGRPLLMVITKDNFKSTVHRPTYLDYIGLRMLDEDGNVIGERRFLGLLASSAYSESVPRIPVLRSKAKEVLRRSGYDEASHGGKAIMDVLDTYPRDELFQTRVSDLAPIVDRVAHLKERRQVRLFVRRDNYSRYLSCLVYLPRDRYTTGVRTRMQDILMEALRGASIDYTARVTESVLARLHFVVRMPVGTPLAEVNVRELERELTRATRSWNDELADALSATGQDGRDLGALVAALPEGYKEDFAQHQAIKDLEALTALQGEDDMSMAIYRPDKAVDEADLRLKIFRQAESLSLSAVLPHLSLLGVDVIDERPYELELGVDERAFIYDFGLKVPGGSETVERRWTPEARSLFGEAFKASYLGQSESDGFNALVMGADLNWREVAVLRAIGRYLKQAGSTHSQTYISAALSANVDIARMLNQLFTTKFDPDLDLDLEERQRRTAAIEEKITSALEDVASLDQDRIVRSYLSIISAMVRTNAFQPDRQAITMKLLPREIPDLPAPRPEFEIFVYSPRVDGVHLRFGAVARGGLRWSDRAEDFRTEVLGLVKAQMVKNAVIVPVGAKGGFYCKRLPDVTVDREAWMAEGVSCYRLFISSLLDVTDNIVGGDVVPPERVVRYDEDDPYLVVAADKGTATFSDTANEISTEAGFWMGDAFASGGSAGYDHKGMGITARGAWESVVRHFREMGIDCQNTDFTCVGVGDMSGDVFGNGMLLSQHTRLVAAFDHRHVFIDPTPDAASSWEERRRLFDLPRSSWADYDTSKISAGGGVFPRTLKSIKITPQMREALDLDPHVTALAPTELISACLRAPVDLFWNGGIGTYVKATSESHAQVGDKANDVLRVNGADLRAKCVGEGGNLGCTQLGRIEYAAKGGRINTDFIDNSAGVDTSDYEVNIKILLAGEMAAGRLELEARDAFLSSMTDEVAQLVLRHNYGQNLALANSEFQSLSMAGVHEDWMERLEDSGLLDRRLEFLPDEETLAARRADGHGLTAPELATLLAYTKIVLEEQILDSDLPDDPYLHDRLINYFPTAMRQKYAEVMPEHRLHREIITTVAVNEFVNASGITCFHRLSGETGALPSEVLRAQIVARELFGAGTLESRIEELDHQVPAAVQTRLRMEIRTLVERVTRWMLNNRRAPIDIQEAIRQFGEGVATVQRTLPETLVGRDADAYRERLEHYRGEGVPEELASAIAALPATYPALTAVQTAAREGTDVLRVAHTHFELGQRLGLDQLLRRIIDLPRDDRWQTMARAALRDDLHTVHAQLTAEVLAQEEETADTGELVERWSESTPSLTKSVETLASICEGTPDLARMSVGLRIVRGLLPASG